VAYLGQLPNGSNVYASQTTFTANSGSTTTGSLTLVGGTSGVNYTFNLSESPSGPSVATAPSPCTIVSGSGQSCQLSFSAGSASPGTYIVTVSYTSSSAIGTLPTTITFIVSGGSAPVTPGSLALSIESVTTLGNSTIATVTLSGSQNVTTPVNVTLSSTSGHLVESPSAQTCALTTSSNTCPITFYANSVGNDIITANTTTPGYSSVAANVSVIATYAYFTNNGNNSYSQCVVNGNFIESNTCINYYSSTFHGPAGIAFHGNYAYITNQATGINTFVRCGLDASGVIESATCTEYSTSPGTLYTPTQIIFNGNYGYFVNSKSNYGSYTQCNLDVNGDLESNACETVIMASLNYNPYQMAFTESYVYFAEYDGLGYSLQCAVDANGGIESQTCTRLQISNNTFYPYGISIYESYAYYLTDSNYLQCSVSGGLIESSTCSLITSVSPDSQNFAPFTLTFYNNYAFFVNYNGSYTRCSTNPNDGGAESGACYNYLIPGSSTPWTLVFH
jgi:hypothetical protein